VTQTSFDSIKNVLSESFLHKKIPRAHKIDLEENMDRTITAPIDRETLKSLHAGDYVYISGTIYTARDAAHKRMIETLDEGRELPLDLKDNVIYYMGPSPAREGRPIGSAGPTTASRMDKYTPRLLDLGMGAMIGKGKRSQAVIDAIVENKAVYFAAVGGAGALLSKCIKKSEVVAYDDLGTEAIRKMTVENLPVIVVIDSKGNNLYETAVADYLKQQE
jgi:fumarate hydratase subunit beta